MAKRKELAVVYLGMGLKIWPTMKILSRGWAGIRAALILTALLAGSGCQTPEKSKPSAAREMQLGPPALAVESFQAAWEILRDTHFDTNFNGLNWDEVRERYLPRVKEAKSQAEVREVLQEMVDLLGVSHLMIIPGTAPVAASVARSTENPGEPTAPNSPNPAPMPTPTRSRSGSLGIEVRPVDGKLVVFRVEPESPAAAKGVRPGTVIFSIDGEPAIDSSLREATEREREFLNWHHAADLLRGAAGEECVLEIDNGAGRKTIRVTRARERGELSQLGNLPPLYTRVSTNDLATASGKKVGYLRFNLWLLPAVETINRFVDEYRNADGIVVDMRGNLGGIGGMVMGVSGHFVNERASLGKMILRDNELNFTAFPRRVDGAMNPTNTFQGRLAILTDAISLSTAELFAAGLQEMGRARVFGQTTGGQALPALSDRLPNGDLLYHAVADFKTPKGRRIEGNGVVPDEVVPLRIEALRAGRDEPLEAALRWMDSAPQAGVPGVR
jgi:carboxyl-terminal processing protease